MLEKKRDKRTGRYDVCPEASVLFSHERRKMSEKEGDSRNSEEIWLRNIEANS